MPALIAMVHDAGLTFKELDGFTVTVGPGAFTGLRVGIATVKGLAYANGKQVAAVSSLAALAMNLSWAAWPVCTLFDARKSEVYAAIYAVSDAPHTLSQEMVITPERLLETISGPTIFIGDGAVRYQELIREQLGPNAYFAAPHLHSPRASSAAALAARIFAADAAVSPAVVSPSYIRPSEAELAKANR
jgi:tRNA threonylcarbamoyladenosine biosynthesis protein TsaB